MIYVFQAQKINCFLENCFWISCGKFSLFRREYLSFPVNVLTNSPKISDITKRDIFELIFCQSD